MPDRDFSAVKIGERKLAEIEPLMQRQQIIYELKDNFIVLLNMLILRFEELRFALYRSKRK